MFDAGQIWAYPTDTSFGLGVRADDPVGLQALFDLKKRSPDKYFSLMVRDRAMLAHFANIPSDLPDDFFTERPRTAILKPSENLPKSPFWPEDKVAFRVCTIPDIAVQIDIPITATSANVTGKSPLYSISELEVQFAHNIKVYDKISKLEPKPPSEIWDFTVSPMKRIR